MTLLRRGRRAALRAAATRRNLDREARAPDPSEACATSPTRSAKFGVPLAGKVPLIGFSGSPYTLACYMVEGQASDDWRNVKLMLHQHPSLLHRLLETNTRAVAPLLNAQIEAGVNE